MIVCWLIEEKTNRGVGIHGRHQRDGHALPPSPEDEVLRQAETTTSLAWSAGCFNYTGGKVRSMLPSPREDNWEGTLDQRRFFGAADVERSTRNPAPCGVAQSDVPRRASGLGMMQAFDARHWSLGIRHSVLGIRHYLSSPHARPTSAKVYPVIVIGSGASGGMAAWNLTRQGVDVLLLDAGEKFERAKFWTHVTPWEDRARRARGERPPEFFLDTKEQPYLTPAGKDFQLNRVWGHRRQDQRLGPRQPALQRDGLPVRRARWLGHSLADPLRRRRTLLRQGRSVDRRVRGRRRLRGAARQQVPSAAAADALRRSRDVASEREDRHPVRPRPSRQHDQAGTWLPGLPLLRPMRARLRHGIVLLLGRPPAA